MGPTITAQPAAPQGADEVLVVAAAREPAPRRLRCSLAGAARRAQSALVAGEAAPARLAGRLAQRCSGALAGVFAAARSTPLLAAALVLGVFTTVVVAWQAALSQFLAASDGCGWDGILYCNAAAGAEVNSPYSRRPLVPWLVQHDPWGGELQRFLTVDLVGVAVSAVLMALLVRRLCGQGVEAPRRSAAALIGVCLLLLTPFALRFALTYPANTDEVSLALGLALVLVVLRERLWLSVPVAFACTLAREQWGAVVVMLAVLDLLWTRRRPLARAALAGAGIGGLVFDFSRPNYGGEPPMGAVVRQYLEAHFASLGGLEQTAWMAVTGFGLVPLLALVGRRRSAHRRDTFVVAVVSVLQIALAVSGGDDTARILMPGAILLTALAVAAVARARSPRRDAVLVALVAGTIAIWRPWVIAPVPGDAWLDWFTPYYDSQYGDPRGFPARLRLDGSIAAAGMLLAVAPMLIPRWRPVLPALAQEDDEERRRRRAASHARRRARSARPVVVPLSPEEAWLAGTGSAAALAAGLAKRRARMRTAPARRRPADDPAHAARGS